MKKILLITLIIFIKSISILFADDFRYLRTIEGLYNGEINSIAQDNNGKLWFATWSGLTSYNGYSFELFKPELGKPNSLPDNKINRIFIGTNNILFISSLSGASVYCHEKQKFYPVNLDGFENESYYIYSFLESKGNILIHTNQGIFLVYNQTDNPSKFRAKRMNLMVNNVLVNDFIHQIKNFDDRLVLISNSSSQIPTRFMISELFFTDSDTVIKIQNRIDYKYDVNSISYSNSEKKIYFATRDGISAFSLLNMTFENDVFFKGINIQNSIITSNGYLYCSPESPELYYADLETRNIGKYLPDPLKVGSLLDNNIMCLFEDFSGNLWIGHQGLGLSILNLYRKAFYSFKRDPSDSKSLSGNVVMSFNGNENEIIIGLRQEGINITGKKFGKDIYNSFEKVGYKGDNSYSNLFNNIWDVAKESESVFWVASNGGVDKLEKTASGWKYGSTDEKPLVKGTVRKLMIDKNGNFWIGTFFGGLIFMPALKNNPSRNFYQYNNVPSDIKSISDKSILTMNIDSKNRIWIGTPNGLNLVDKKYDQLNLTGNEKPEISFTRFKASSSIKNSLNSNEINCIYENLDGKIWIATQGGGINFLDPDSMKFSYLTSENGLPGNDVLGILNDETGSKWISTNKGIVVYNPSSTSRTFTNYSHTDGIQGETFKINSFHKCKDGEMFFGGDNGFTRFYPSEIKSNPIPPKIGLTNLKILNFVVNVGDTISKGNIMNNVLDELENIKLPFSKNTFSIGVAVHHFQYPQGNMIRYKLEGFSDRWITMQANVQNIYFSKLPYGNYILRITGISGDNVIADEDRLIKIVIMPPWYKTWYFQSFILFFIIGAVLFIIKIFTIKQRKNFQRKVDAITLENNENKMRFLANIAHELRTPLSLVIAPIEDLRQNFNDFDPKWRNHINLIYRNSNYLFTLINQIIDFRKLNAGKLQLNIEKGNLTKLLNDVVLNFSDLDSRRKTNLKLTSQYESIIAEYDSQKIEEILYNLLSNAFKHTKENGIIEVNCKVEFEKKDNQGNKKDWIRISVFNEGKDIADEEKTKIFERFYKVNEKIEGAGIGLSFSKSLVELHEGQISVESVENRGVVFHVDLPFNKVEIFQQTEASNEYKLDWHEQRYKNTDYKPDDEKGNKDLSIVIVEDNSDLRSFLVSALSGRYECFEASDGQEGYEIITQIIPDIIISDVIMPKIDGYTLCAKVKDNAKTCHIPIILLTANNASEHIVSGYNKGADAYITKPFEMKIVKAQISRLILNRELIREKYITQNFMVEVTSSNINKDDEFILKLRNLLEENLSESDFNVKKLSADLNISTTHLYRKLKALTGLSPVEFIRIFKLQKACEMLSTTNYSIKEIGYALGFNNLSYFVKCFREQFKVTPSTFRKKGMPETE